MKFYILPFWWFLLLGSTPVIVGPYHSEKQCMAWAARLSTESTVRCGAGASCATTCWSDSDALPKKDHQ